ncbi:regulation of nuclear pre-mRNA domain-containing protein 1B-like [Xenia sp. Carnegie-2017]|uniref:regulation of nuclear pre-mRNA domain-containing protein 1B-like n=1 Tax=Xenia sp. Carnegie-2017 TaxID=2897299 RepID=UPI001F04BEFB|nr:regulation of nuclear pre-mRNA domain-containing protein 1B-like [Xenia sp. Carnegie-2017]
MSFSSSALEKKLSELSSSQQSIQTLSLWLIHHRKHAKTVVDVWSKQLLKVKPAKKMTFMYLCNDVLQNSRKKGTEFNKEFVTALPNAISHCSKEFLPEMQKSLERIIDIWSQRGVYEAGVIEKFQASLASKTSSPAAKRSRIEPPSNEVDQVDNQNNDEHNENDESEDDETAEPPESDYLIKALKDLERSASQDAEVRERIANLPTEVQDASGLEKIQDRESAEKLAKVVESACVLLADYNGRLSAELEDRTTVCKMLKAYLSSQKKKVADCDKRIEKYKAKLEKVALVRKELRAHLDNLPDLSLLPDVTGGLAPLPSAGDLFAR